MPVATELLDAVYRLTPVALSELDKARLMDRVDTKFVVDDTILPDLLAGLRNDYRVLEVDGTRCSPYHSDYFDSRGSKCYLEHHNGKQDRYKFRTRQYVNSGISFFEVKHRTNKGRTIKKRVPVSQADSPLNEESQKLVAEVYGRPIELCKLMRTAYVRTTLVSNTDAERVTIDTNLKFSTDDSMEPLRGVAIIEVKQGRDSRGSLVRTLLRNQRIKPFRISKYCIGRALLDPSLKQNRFKRKLRFLQKQIANHAYANSSNL